MKAASPPLHRAGSGLSVFCVGAFCLIMATVSGIAQDGASQMAPLPPVRPFDLDMPATRPSIITPQRAPAAAAPEEALQFAPVPPSRPSSLPPRPASLDQEAPQEQPPSFFPGFNFPGIGMPSVPPVPPPDIPPAQPPAPQPAPPPAQRASVEPPPAQERQWPFRLPWQRDDPAESAPVDDTPTGPGITTDPGTSIDCLPARLKSVLSKVAAKYGSVRVTSTYRPGWRARRGSYHRRCEAVDFRVPGHRPGAVMAHIRDWEEVGGRKVYWNGLLHVDIGPVRSW